MTVKKWKVIAPLAMAAAGSLAAGVSVLLKKLPKPGISVSQAAPAKTANLKIGCYSFISGFKDAATVELRLDYAPEQFSFVVVEDEFLNYSSDSHVAIVWGHDFNLQLEYAGYYSGEDFAAHRAAMAEKYKTANDFVCGARSGFWVLDGDNVAIHLPIPNDAHSYLLVTVQKTADYDDEVTTLPDYPPLKELLATIRFKRN